MKMEPHQDAGLDLPDCERSLLLALSGALHAFHAESDECSALGASFNALVQGLRAERSFLVRVEPTTRRLGQVVVCRNLTPFQVEALLSGTSTPGVSATLVRAALRSGHTQVIEDARLALRTGDVTGSLARGDYSVACAPICDPYLGGPLAVLYIQTSSLTAPLTRALGRHIDAYALALGHAWHLWERGQRQPVAARRGTGAGPRTEIVGHSAAICALRERIQRLLLPAMAAEWPDPILITGETGTGKDVLARHLHAHSRRARGPFIPLNCALFRGDRLESELFGHVKGAFTGADRASDGIFVAAHQGVLFLDELGDMPLEGQVMLLRAIETRRVRPLGGSQERDVDVQVLCATNKNVVEEVKAGRFREDLYHRLKYLAVTLVPLRERQEDIRPLLSHYLRHHQRRLGKRVGGLSRRVLRLLVDYSWPGNVRELSASCSRLVTYTPAGRPIDERVLLAASPEVFDEARRTSRPASLATEAGSAGGTLALARAAFQRAYVAQVGQEVGWNKTAMAQRLGINRCALHRLLKRYDLKEDNADE